MNTNTAEPFSYRIKVTSKAVELVLVTGAFYRRYELTSNISNLLTYLLDLLRRKAFVYLRVGVPVRSDAGTEDIPVGILPEGNTDAWSRVEARGATFVFHSVYVPILENHKFLVGFLEDLFAAVREFGLITGKTTTGAYVVPTVTIQENSGLVITVTTPTADGVTSVVQSLTLGTRNVTGVLDMLRIAYEENTGSHVIGNKFRNTMKRSLTKGRWILTNESEIDGNIVNIDRYSQYYVPNGVVHIMFNALKSHFEKSEVWRNAVYDKDDFRNAKLMVGDQERQMQNLLPPKPTPPTEKATKDQETEKFAAELKFPLTIPPFLKGSDRTFNTRADLDAWMKDWIAPGINTYIMALTKLTNSAK